MDLTAITQFAGGIGLFLLGMRLMSDGLKFAAGPALRQMLARATGSLWRAVGSGVLITALVQSSSAVVFATIGFVNAGLLSLGQAIGVVFGANVGTTFTSWIVALVGFDIKLQAFALPAVALGMGLWIASKGRRAALGQALVGFGVFFLGLDVLKGAFADIDQSWALGASEQGVWLSRLLFALAGVFLTVLMQSSSAALAVTLTAAAQGLLPLSAAAAMVIGANLGTTSTAIFASIGATAAARRTAAAHVAFNLCGGSLAFLILPWLLQLSLWLALPAGGDQHPATVLALLHTLINVLGLLAIWPLTAGLVAWLERHFAGRIDSQADIVRHLDRNVLRTPALAVDAVLSELARLGNNALAMSRAVLSQEPGSEIDLGNEHSRLERVASAIMDFIPSIETGGVERIEHSLPRALRIAQYLRAAGERAVELSHQAPLAEADPAVAERLASVHLSAAGALDRVAAAFSQGGHESSSERLQQQLDEFESAYQGAKAELLRLGSRGQLGSAGLVRILDRLSGLRRIVEQLGKGAGLYVDIERQRVLPLN
ncbi:Na/Pi cotransporter family protein [Pseudomarimonas arenosa]|uniref:Na/Pi symporter n=1 Tax=Pseudomarimonas arenosa TaxID=2774145 RepID=A0AAW3ZII9_9GAMM|nr:Na/Pi symporter [Pseudomarimonas arenosa]MBD8525811.1 Na/Pi symporter [Pseudomarimonas arenosa]